MKSAREIIYKRFITPFEGRERGNVGVELEFPLINKNGGNVDTVFVSSIMDYFEEKGFRCVLWGVGGEKLFMENENGDTLSFDNSYNNFEFSMMYGDNLLDIHKRFSEYYSEVQAFLDEGNHTLLPRGTNPNYPGIDVNHTPFSTYNMVQEYLHKFPGTHGYNDFPAFMSSVQTHLDTDVESLPETYTLFCRMDFVRGLLFGNSPDFEGKGWRISRDYLWEKSGFGNCPEITGSVDYTFNTTDDIVDFFVKKGMFNRIRDGKYEVFGPVAIEKYFSEEKYGAREEDIECYLSFRNVEITSRGTLEVRSDCTQPDGKFFMPPAFNLGMIYNAEKVRERLENFFKANDIDKPASVLRNLVCEARETEIAPKEVLDTLCADMLEIAREGLKKRGKGEEILI